MTDIVKILEKHRAFAKHYKEVKSFSFFCGNIIKVNYYVEGCDDETKYFLVIKDFNYYREEKESYDEHFMYGNFFDNFIRNRTLKEIDQVAIFDATVDCHVNSYGLYAA